MGTLIIKNVDLDKLDKAVCELFLINDGVLDTMLSEQQSLALSNIRVMLSCAVDSHRQKSLGSIENQKAKLRQMDIDWSNHAVVMVFQCPVCGYQGGHNNCPHCNVPMEPIENVK